MTRSDHVFVRKKLPWISRLYPASLKNRAPACLAVREIALHLDRFRPLKPQCLKAALEKVLFQVAKDSRVERVREAVIQCRKELCDEACL